MNGGARHPARASYVATYLFTHKEEQGRRTAGSDGTSGATFNTLDGSWSGEITPASASEFLDLVAADANEGRYTTYLSENGTSPVLRAFADVDGELRTVRWSPALVLHLMRSFSEALRTCFPGAAAHDASAPLAAFETVYAAAPSEWCTAAGDALVARKLRPRYDARTSPLAPRKLGLHLVAPHAVMTSYQLMLVGATFQRAVTTAFPHDDVRVDVMPYIHAHLRPLFCDRPVPCTTCAAGAATAVSTCGDARCVNRRRPRGTVYVPALVLPAGAPDAVKAIVTTEMQRLWLSARDALHTFSIRATAVQIAAGPSPGFNIAVACPQLCPLPSYTAVHHSDALDAPVLQVTKKVFIAAERAFTVTLECASDPRVRAAQQLISQYVVHDVATVAPAYLGAPPTVRKYAGARVGKLQQRTDGSFVATVLGEIALWCENRGGMHLKCGNGTSFLLRKRVIERAAGVEVLALCSCRAAAPPGAVSCFDWSNRRKHATPARRTDIPNFMWKATTEYAVLFPAGSQCAGDTSSEHVTTSLSGCGATRSSSSAVSCIVPREVSPVIDLDAYSQPKRARTATVPPVTARVGATVPLAHSTATPSVSASPLLRTSMFAPRVVAWMPPGPL